MICWRHTDGGLRIGFLDFPTGVAYAGGCVSTTRLAQYGIVMWNGPNFTAMTSYVGSGWKTDLTGQLDFLEYELESDSWFRDIHQKIIKASLENTFEAAKNTARTVCIEFERPRDKYIQAEKRAAIANKFWDAIVTQPRSSSTSSRMQQLEE